jgi:hypothetical protein
MLHPWGQSQGIVNKGGRSVFAENAFPAQSKKMVIVTKWPWVFAEILSFLLHFHPYNRSVCLLYFVWVSEGVRILKAE